MDLVWACPGAHGCGFGEGRAEASEGFGDCGGGSVGVFISYMAIGMIVFGCFFLDIDFRFGIYVMIYLAIFVFSLPICV